MSLEITEFNQVEAEERSPNNQFPDFMWLEITGSCQLACDHCYAESGPNNTHGKMAEEDWHKVIDDSTELGLKRVQFIGGEPTLHPALPNLVDHTLGNDIGVEVYSNMTHIRPAMWKTLSQEGVSLATSFYSDNADQHDAITKQRGSYERTKANIIRSVDLGIPLRIGLVAIREGQRIEEAKAQLADLGVQPEHIRVDHIREVGRGVKKVEKDIGELCGRCTVNLAVGPDGTVWPCVFSRWLVAGNVLETPIGEIIQGSELRSIRGKLDTEFAGRIGIEMGCDPSCSPYDCDPYDCGPYN